MFRRKCLNSLYTVFKHHQHDSVRSVFVFLFVVTHIGDDGDEGVSDGEGEALRCSRLEALLHQGKAVLPAEQADVTQQMQRNLHVLDSRGRQRAGRVYKRHRNI